MWGVELKSMDGGELITLLKRAGLQVVVDYERGVIRTQTVNGTELKKPYIDLVKLHADELRGFLL